MMMQNKLVIYSKIVPTNLNRAGPFLIENVYLLYHSKSLFFPVICGILPLLFYRFSLRFWENPETNKAWEAETSRRFARR